MKTNTSNNIKANREELLQLSNSFNMGISENEIEEYLTFINSNIESMTKLDEISNPYLY